MDILKKCCDQIFKEKAIKKMRILGKKNEKKTAKKISFFIVLARHRARNPRMGGSFARKCVQFLAHSYCLQLKKRFDKETPNNSCLASISDIVKK